MFNPLKELDARLSEKPNLVGSKRFWLNASFAGLIAVASSAPAIPALAQPPMPINPDLAQPNKQYLPLAQSPEPPPPLTEAQIVQNSIIESSGRLGKQIEGVIIDPSFESLLSPEDQSKILRTAAASYFFAAQSYDQYSNSGEYPHPSKNVKNITFKADRNLGWGAITEFSATPNPFDGSSYDVTITFNPNSVGENASYIAAHEMGHAIFSDSTVRDPNKWYGAYHEAVGEATADMFAILTLLSDMNTLPQNIRPDITGNEIELMLLRIINTSWFGFPNSRSYLNSNWDNPVPSLPFFLRKLDDFPDDIRNFPLLKHLPYIFSGKLNQRVLLDLQDVVDGDFASTLESWKQSLLRFFAEQTNTHYNAQASHKLTDRLDEMVAEGFMLPLSESPLELYPFQIASAEQLRIIDQAVGVNIATVAYERIWGINLYYAYPALSDSGTIAHYVRIPDHGGIIPYGQYELMIYDDHNGVPDYPYFFFPEGFHLAPETLVITYIGADISIPGVTPRAFTDHFLRSQLQGLADIHPNEPFARDTPSESIEIDPHKIMANKGYLQVELSGSGDGPQTERNPLFTPPKLRGEQKTTQSFMVHVIPGDSGVRKVIFVDSRNRASYDRALRDNPDLMQELQKRGIEFVMSSN